MAACSAPSPYRLPHRTSGLFPRPGLQLTPYTSLYVLSLLGTKAVTCHCQQPCSAHRMPSPGSFPFTTWCWRRGAALRSCCVGAAKSPILTQMWKVRTFSGVLSVPSSSLLKTQRSPLRPLQLAQRTWSACSTLRAQSPGQGQHGGCRQESEEGGAWYRD